MRNELLFRDDYIAIEYNSSGDWIYVNWRGYQNYDSVKAGCERLLELMKAQACFKILNDNTQVEGQWSSAAKWGGDVWFPAMRKAGLKWFAWVYSPSMLSRLSSDKMLRHTLNPDFVEVFEDVDLAEAWLRTKV
jgi:hypothetical protein